MAERTATTSPGFDPLRNERLRALLDHPALFNLSQLLISGGQRATKRWAQAWLGARPGDRLLDVCCGTGEFAPLFPPEQTGIASYLGVDLNEQYITTRRSAGAAWRGAVSRRPMRRNSGLPEGSFDRALFVQQPAPFPG